MFGEYVLKGRTYVSLAQQSGISPRKLELAFHHFLDQVPPPLVLPLPAKEFQYLIYDGLWFGKKFCLMTYRIYQDPFIIATSIRKTERSTQIAQDLKQITKLGYQLDGLVSDGGTGVVTAAKKVFPFKPHQTCLAHVHRQATLGLGRRTKDYRLQRLQQLAHHLFLIESKAALTWWVGEVKIWAKLNGDYLNEYTHDNQRHRWWFTHPRARSTLRILLAAQDTSFTFLNHPLMPKTTNGIEGIFSNLRTKWQIHRGLKRKRWANFLLWFVYFRNQQVLADRNTKGD